MNLDAHFSPLSDKEFTPLLVFMKIWSRWSLHKFLIWPKKSAE